MVVDCLCKDFHLDDIFYLPFKILLSFVDSSFFSNLFSTARNYMLYHWHLGNVCSSSARQPSTAQKCDIIWNHWNYFAMIFDFGIDPFLDAVKSRYRVILVSCSLVLSAKKILSERLIFFGEKNCNDRRSSGSIL